MSDDLTTGRRPLRGGARRQDLPRSSIYTEEYFLSGACEGIDEYLDGRVSVVKERELEFLEPRSGDRVLDLGSGRGESSAELLRRGACPIAVDYSADAVRVTARTLATKAPVLRADGTRLPFASGSFDRVLLGDVIEHLPWALAVEALGEVQRVLAPGGRALIHTSPNTWFISVVMPPLRLVLRLLRHDEVLGRFAEYDRLREAMHPNELSPTTLPRLMRAAGVPARTWVDRDVLRSGGSEWTRRLSQSPLVRAFGALAGVWPLRLLVGNDLYALIVHPNPALSGSGR
ncbi:MAG: class I SAM-dependent methyltransferase [Acidimicrobiales bacterium]